MGIRNKGRSSRDGPYCEQGMMGNAPIPGLLEMPIESQRCYRGGLDKMEQDDIASHKLVRTLPLVIHGWNLESLLSLF